MGFLCMPENTCSINIKICYFPCEVQILEAYGDDKHLVNHGQFIFWFTNVKSNWPGIFQLGLIFQDQPFHVSSSTCVFLHKKVYLGLFSLSNAKSIIILRIGHSHKVYPLSRLKIQARTTCRMFSNHDHPQSSSTSMHLNIHVGSILNYLSDQWSMIKVALCQFYS